MPPWIMTAVPTVIVVTVIVATVTVACRNQCSYQSSGRRSPCGVAARREFGSPPFRERPPNGNAIAAVGFAVSSCPHAGRMTLASPLSECKGVVS